MQAELGEHGGRGVDGEVVAGIHRAGRDQREHADQRFAHHRAVADEARVALFRNHLGRGTRSDQ